MSDSTDSDFYNLRQQGKIYISKVFTYGGSATERVRYVRIVLENSDSVQLGEIEDALCLRISGRTRKTQITALVTQDHKQVRRVTLQQFQSRSNGNIHAYAENEFTFRQDEFERLVNFLEKIDFIDLTNEATFQIEDISSQAGAKLIVDARDKHLIEQVVSLGGERRQALLSALSGTLSHEEINSLLGRRKGLEEFEAQLSAGTWSESDWQEFFERQDWVFGYGLDYRIMRPFDREMVVGGVGTDNRNKPIVDFLNSFKDYTVLVEIKRPGTRIFKEGKGGRSGTWDFSPEFVSAVSQVIEQKVEWAAFAQNGEHFTKDGRQKLESRTRNAKAILVMGSIAEFDREGDARSRQVMRDTFELFRRETRTIEIVTFDELLERARFITKSK